MSGNTANLPRHVRESSNRFIAVADGFGLFHYMPGSERDRELRSVVVQTGDVVVFTRRLVHTFTAPVVDLVLLSYHMPFFEFDDVRQFTILREPHDFRFASMRRPLASFLGPEAMAARHGIGGRTS